MRPASAALIAQLTELHFHQIYKSPEAWIQAIEAVGNQPRSAVACCLAPLALVDELSVAHAAVKTLNRVLAALDDDELVHVAGSSRSFVIVWAGEYSYWQKQWDAMNSSDVRRFASFKEEAWGVFCLASAHSNGYVRQASVEQLASFHGRVPFAFLLVRLNDWVVAIRGLAQASVYGRLKRIYQGDEVCRSELLDNIMLTARIAQWRRADHGPILQAIDATLATNSRASLLERAAKSPGLARTLRLMKIALENEAHAPESFLFQAMQSPRPHVRTWAAREATKRLSTEALRRIVEKMKHDAMASIRHEAVFILGTKLLPFAPEELIPFLSDPSSNVRFLAAYLLEKNGMDVRRHYSSVLSNAQAEQLAPILAGIGERGKPGDEIAVAPYLHHADPHVRRAAVFTTGKLRKDNDLSWIVQALGDSHKLVVREAARQMDARIHIADAHVIEKWFQSERRLSMRRDALRIGAKMERWNALVFLLEAARSDDEVILRDVERELRRWLEQFVNWYAAPNQRTRERLVQVFAEVRTKLERSLADRIAGRISFRDGK